MNLAVMIGRLTKDPDIRYIQSTGNYVTRFSIAVDRTFTRKDGVTADFFNIVVWGKQAESCANYLGKGRLVAVKGRIENRSYETNAGEKRYVTEIIAENVQFLDWGDKGGKKSNAKNYPEPDNQDEGVFNEEDSSPDTEGLDEAGYRALSDDNVPF